MRESGIQLGIRMSMGGYGWWGMEGRWIQDFLLQTNSYASPLNTLGQASGPHPLSQHKLPVFSRMQTVAENNLSLVGCEMGLD